VAAPLLIRTPPPFFPYPPVRSLFFLFPISCVFLSIAQQFYAKVFCLGFHYFVRLAFHQTPCLTLRPFSFGSHRHYPGFFSYPIHPVFPRRPGRPIQVPPPLVELMGLRNLLFFSRLLLFPPSRTPPRRGSPSEFRWSGFSVNNLGPVDSSF